MTQRLKFEQLEQFGFGPRIMRRTKLCPCCSSLVTDAGRTCPSCGSALANLTLLRWYEQQHLRCPSCGTVLREDSCYCPHCGKTRSH